MHSLFTVSDFIVRLQLSCVLVFGTYNPSGHSYFHWVVDGDTDTLILKIFVGMTLVAAYSLILVVSWLALDAVGLTLLVLAVLALGGTLWELDLFPADPWSVQAVLLGGLAIVFAIGLSFSGIRYRLSRQVQSSSISRSPLF